MAQPTRGDVHVNRPLTNISIAYIQESKDFIADQVFPIVPVEKQGDRYFVYNKADWFRTEAAVRAPGTETAGSGYTIDNTPTYFADVWGVHKDVDDQTRANSDTPLSPDRDATLFVTQQMMLRREKQFNLKYLIPGIWGNDVTPSPLWSATTGDPMKDIDAYKAVIKARTGFTPNTLVVSYDVHVAIKNLPSVLDRIKYTQRGIVTEELLASLLGVDKYLVSSAVQNTAAEGAAFAGSFLNSNRALLVYSNPTPSLMQPSAGYIFAWKGLFGAGAAGTRIKSFRMENLGSDRIEGESAYDMHMVGADLGTYITPL